MNRRQFIRQTVVAAAMAGSYPLALSAASAAPAAVKDRSSVHWPIGCFNRPWAGDKRNWGYDTALDGIKAAGYKYTGLLTRTPNEPFAGSDATPEYLEKIKKRIASRGLAPIMAALRTKDGLSFEQQVKDMRKQIENAKFIGVEFLLTFGVGKAEHLENYYKLMRDAAAYSAERKMKLVLKPHGGSSSAAQEILESMEKVGHPNFKIWFDAGNIVFYTGKDPVEELKLVAKHVTGFCAKDCDGQKGSVWLEFGKGKANFPAVFRELKQAGFNGPVMVECCELGDTPEIVTANARKNREYLEHLFASL